MAGVNELGTYTSNISLKFARILSEDSTVKFTLLLSSLGLSMLVCLSQWENLQPLVAIASRLTDSVKGYVTVTMVSPIKISLALICPLPLGVTSYDTS